MRIHNIPFAKSLSSNGLIPKQSTDYCARKKKILKKKGGGARGGGGGAGGGGAVTSGFAVLRLCYNVLNLSLAFDIVDIVFVVVVVLFLMCLMVLYVHRNRMAY